MQAKLRKCAGNLLDLDSQELFKIRIVESVISLCEHNNMQ